MKKALTIICIALLPMMSKAQDKEVAISGISVLKKAGEVVVQFHINPQKGSVKSNYKMIVTPVLYTDKDSVILPGIEVFGKQKARRERQEQLLAQLGKITTDRMRVPVGESTDYRITIPYEKWMKTVSFKLVRKLEGCCSENTLNVENRTDGIVLYKKPIPVFTKIAVHRVVTEVNKRWQFTKEHLVVHFTVGHTNIEPAYMDNQQPLSEIVEAVRKIQDNPETNLREIEISGFASPEGSLAVNTKLGEKRAQSLKYYIQQRFQGIANASFKLINGTENWGELRRMVAASGMQYRDEVLNIIDNVPILKGREKQLMDLKWGRPYNYMLKEFFPVLRNACYVSVYYDVLGDTVADAINQAVELVHNGDYENALEILQRVDTDSRSYNAIGVCYMMMENDKMASQWFKKAIEAGDTTAEKNLEQIK